MKISYDGRFVTPAAFEVGRGGRGRHRLPPVFTHRRPPWEIEVRLPPLPPRRTVAVHDEAGHELVPHRQLSRTRPKLVTVWGGRVDGAG